MLWCAGMAGYALIAGQHGYVVFYAGCLAVNAFTARAARLKATRR
jgi:hypothetical protein